MRRLIAILSLSLAYSVMSLLSCIPHHHHDNVVCFDWVYEELHTNDDNDSCCHDAAHEGCDHSRESHRDTECSILAMLQKVLNDTQLRISQPHFVALLPEWRCECCECVELELLAIHHNIGEAPILYDSPDVGISALRAPPAV